MVFQQLQSSVQKDQLINHHQHMLQFMNQQRNMVFQQLQSSAQKDQLINHHQPMVLQ